MFVDFSVFESFRLNPLYRDSASVTPERARWLGCLVDLLKTGDTVHPRWRWRSRLEHRPGQFVEGRVWEVVGGMRKGLWGGGGVGV